jgi:hypothetical protein
VEDVKIRPIESLRHGAAREPTSRAGAVNSSIHHDNR